MGSGFTGSQADLIDLLLPSRSTCRDRVRDLLVCGSSVRKTAGKKLPSSSTSSSFWRSSRCLSSARALPLPTSPPPSAPCSTPSAITRYSDKVIKINLRLSPSAKIFPGKMTECLIRPWWLCGALSHLAPLPVPGTSRCLHGGHTGHNTFTFFIYVYTTSSYLFCQ